jgi:hypothetical protein
MVISTMKGLEPLQWTFITLAITLVIVVFAINPLQSAIDQAIASSAELTAEKLRSAINLMQVFPSVSEHTVEIKARKCKIKIDEKSVTVEMKTSATLNLIQTDNKIISKEIDCSNQKILKIKKFGNEIRFE